MKEAALLLGGTGFVGRHLALQLADRYAVTVTGRERSVAEVDAVRATVSEVRPALVVNLAAITTVRASVEDPRTAYETGIVGTLNILEVLTSSGFQGRYLQVSSSEVYGHPAANELPLTESAPLRPMSPYAVAKTIGEQLCQTWSQSADFMIFITRPFTHVGPGQSLRFAVARFAHQLAEIKSGRREPILFVGNLEATRDITDVRDVVQAYDYILHQGTPRAVYNVCSGREVVMGDVLHELVRLAGERIRIIEDAALARPSEQMRICGSYERLHHDTGWHPRRQLGETLADTLAAARTLLPSLS